MARTPEDAKTTKTRGRHWWIDRWRRSSAFIEMTLAEQGAYHNLLDEQRLRGGTIPNDERLLGKACGDPLEWPAVRFKVLRWFVCASCVERPHDEHDGPVLWNTTATEVNAATDALSSTRSEAGRQGYDRVERGDAGRFTGKATGKSTGKPTGNDAGNPTGNTSGKATGSVVRGPLSVSESVSGRTEDGAEPEHQGTPATEEPPPTTATPAEARAKALDRLGQVVRDLGAADRPKDCPHTPLLAKQPLRRTTVCHDCGEDVRPTEKPNPFLADGGRDAWELEALKLTRDIGALRLERQRAGEHLADDEPVDGVEVFAMAAHYEGAAPGRTKCNPASLREDRLVNTVLDLRATLKAEQAKRRSA